MPVTWFRLLSKLILYCLYVQTCAGHQSESALVKEHIVYISVSTLGDAFEESKQGDWVKWTHHVATWWLLLVYLLPVPFASNITVHLLGAVDLTDLFFYGYQVVEVGWLRTVVQLVFAVVWVMRRVLVFGVGDWGYWLLKAHEEMWDKSMAGLIVVSYPPMILLLMTNYYWTACIVAATMRRIERWTRISSRHGK